jgi:NADH-quinone oxidoreductase subunit E
MNDKKFEFSKETMDYINEWKDKPGNLIMILHRVQEQFGFIPRKVAFELAEMIPVPLAKIYSVLTFYHYFKLDMPGENRISVCLGTACYLKGNADIIAELEDLLGIAVNGVTGDSKFSLEVVRCIGCCGLAPVMTVNEKVYGNLTKEKLHSIIAQYKG